ncbi:MAG: class I SAM-dependent methyltransferase [Rubrivivax sp.]
MRSLQASAVVRAHSNSHRGPIGLPWPLPALLAWAAGWAVLALAGWSGVAAEPALIGSMLAASAVAGAGTRGGLRFAIAALGFPLSAVALGSAAAPPWAWLVLLLPLLAAYPLRAWRDAPFFPSPADALVGIDALVLQPPERVMDAGCGLGHGLQALHSVWPRAKLHGLEWSLPLTLLARLRCRRIGARVRRGDMWAASWADFDLVYLFQRPENMARAFHKFAHAVAGRPRGGWLLSLEFEVPGPEAKQCLRGCLKAREKGIRTGGRRRALWVYRLPGTAGESQPSVRSTARTTGR